MKKLLKIIILFTIVTSLSLPRTHVMAASNIQIGDYIEFGRYDQDEIVWQVIGYDQYGHGILWSDSIVDFLAFDGAESGLSGSGNIESDQFGSNKYYNSNIKEWLNSSQQIVSFTTGKPTSKAVVNFEAFDGTIIKGDYDTKPGFLNAFSLLEKSALVNREIFTKSVSTIMNSNYTFSIGTIEEALNLYDLGESMSVNGEVFLLSIEELSHYVINNNLEILKSTSNSLDKSYYWLRTPDGKNLKAVMTIDHSGSVFKTDANYSATGVVPAITLNFGLTPILSGFGSKSSPYKLDLNMSNDLIKTFDYTMKSAVLQKVLAFKNSLNTSSDIHTKEIIARTIEQDLITSVVADDLKVLYKYYMTQNNVFIHRDLFTKNHLLQSENVSESLNFTDIEGLTSSEKKAISLLTTYGIIDGYTDGTFRPNKPVTRSEVSKIISLGVQLEKNKYTNEFKDITTDQWFADYVASIKARDFVKGYPDGSFKPFDTITYDEMSAIVSRILKENNSFYSVNISKKKLNSESVVRKWASLDVNLLLENQLIDLNKTYNGNAQMTRIDIVMLMEKLIKLIYQ